jgi:hypothetical protein
MRDGESKEIRRMTSSGIEDMALGRRRKEKKRSGR